MGTYTGNDSNNTYSASQEWNSGDWWNPFDGYYEWRPWTMVGKGGNDKLTGGAKTDYIYGDYKLGGYPTTGLSGHDTLAGRGSADYIYGENGDDLIYGDYGFGSVTGDGGVAGNDWLYGGYGNDSIYGEDGDDILFGEGGYDYLSGGNGHDSIYGGTEADTLSGEYGNDYLNGGDQNDTMYGGAGSDTLSGGNGDDYLGGYGVTLYEKDWLNGGAGYDKFVLGTSYNVQYTGDGINGYAVVSDFTYGFDKIQVKGSLSNYNLQQGYWGTGSSAIQDTGILYNGELIGIVQDNTSVQLNGSYFVTV